MLKAENQAVSAISELKGIANIIPNQSILINAIVLQESKDSSEIENIITTRDELYKAVSVTTKKIDPATKEVLYYREALYEGFMKIQKRNLLSVNDIIDLQKIIVQNEAGIRSNPGTALINDKTNEVIYTPPENNDLIRSLLENLTKYIHEGEGSLTKLAILHYQFESIHPFYDGNGRTGRIINILYLILNGYLEIPILYLSSYIIRNKKRYYELLLKVTQTNEWEEWIVFILKGIELTATDTIKKIRKIRSSLDSTIELIKTDAHKIYSKELVESLFLHPYCKIEFITRELNVERKAASRYLHTLSDLGILELYKIGNENIFINKELMEILKIGT
nr:Fic/DOC family N-terminal domain-containing protein [Salinispira pacifica]